MAEQPIQTYNPVTGGVEDIDPEATGRAAEATGARELSYQEQAQYQAQKAEEARQREHSGLAETNIAYTVGKLRGIGETIGLPVDQLATDIGGEETRSYLEDLKKYHPYASGFGELGGQVFGGIATGGAGGVEAAGQGIARRYGAAGVRGALENMVIGSTSDINESALGNPNEAAEKILANLPSHAALGFAGGVVGHGIGEGVSALLNAGASAAESGLRRGADALVDPELRKAFGNDIPKDIAGALEARQAGFRSQTAAAHAAERESLLGRQQTEAWRQAADQEAAQLAAAKRTQVTIDDVAKQNAQREAEIAAAGVSAKDTLLGKQAEEKARALAKNVTTEQTRSVDQEWARIAHQKEVDGAIKELTEQHQMARKALEDQTKEAVETAAKLGKERDTIRSQVKNLAAELDKVKGAERPNPQNILAAVGMPPAKPVGAFEAIQGTGANLLGDVDRVAPNVLGNVPPDALGAMVRSPEGHSVQFDRFVGDDGKLEAYAKARTAAGNLAGEFGVTFSKRDGKTIAKTDNLFMEAASQGQGVGSEIARNIEDSYRRLGVNEVELNASQVGRYTWAKDGYEWSPKTNQEMKGDFRNWLQKNGLPTEEADSIVSAKSMADSPNGKKFLLSDDAPNWVGTKKLEGATSTSLNPASDNARALLSDWVSAFEKKHADGLSFKQLQDTMDSLDVLEKRTRVYSGSGHDPDVAKAIDTLRNATRQEFERASEATASSVSEARNLSASRLRELYPQAQKAYREALDHADEVQGLAGKFETQAAKETRIAQAEAKRSMERLEGKLAAEAEAQAKEARKTVRELGKEHEEGLSQVEKETEAAANAHRVEAKGAEKDAQRAGDRRLSEVDRKAERARSDLLGKQKEEMKALGKPSKETPVDTLLKKYRRTEPAEDGAGSKILGLGSAMLSLLHGNVASAAMSALRELSGGAARGAANLTASNTLRSLADHLAGIDRDVFNIAGKVTGRYARQAADQRSIKAPPSRSVSFEKASQQVINTQSNPLILESKVRQVAGPWAQDAPEVYSALLQAAQRQQEFLATKLPSQHQDPLSPTPQVAPSAISETEKYEFLQYFKASNDPVQAMKDVVSGHGNSLQVEAVKECFPLLYKQAQAEVARQLSAAKSPLSWEQQENLSTLLGQETSQLMTGAFQTSQAQMYVDREEGEQIQGASKPRSVNSNVTTSLQSAGQAIQENM